MSRDLDRMDALKADNYAFEIFIEAALVTILAEFDSPQTIAEKIGRRAKRSAEALRRQLDNAAIALPMEDHVTNMVRNLSIVVSGLEGKRSTPR
jgi:hypothetical protein